MIEENRLNVLQKAIEAATNDETRYAVGAKLRELGYIDLADFQDANPPAEHVAQITSLLGS